MTEMKTDVMAQYPIFKFAAWTTLRSHWLLFKFTAVASDMLRACSMFFHSTRFGRAQKTTG